MKDKILSALKRGVADPKTGKTSINDTTLSAYVELIAAQISDETQIEAAIAPHLVILKEVQGNINSVAAAAVKNIKPAQPQTQQQPPVVTEEEEMPKWAKTILGEISEIKGTKVHTDLQNKLLGIIGEKKVPETFYQPALLGRKFEKEDDVIQLADTITASYEKYQQSIANSNPGTPPEGGTPPAPDADAKAVAEMINAGTKEIKEQNK